MEIKLFNKYEGDGPIFKACKNIGYYPISNFFKENFPDSSEGILAEFCIDLLPGEAEAAGLDDLCLCIVEQLTTGRWRVCRALLFYARFQECWEFVDKEFECMSIRSDNE